MPKRDRGGQEGPFPEGRGGELWLARHWRGCTFWRSGTSGQRRGLTTVTSFVFLFFFFFLILCICLRYKDSHPLSPLHTRRLKSQPHEIITTFPNSTPRHGSVLGGGGIPPLHSPSLRLIPLGFLLSVLMDFVFFG